MNPIIGINDLHRNFGGQKAVDGMTFTVGAGEVFGLLGPNSAGITTTVRLLKGILPPSAGTARVFGLDPAWQGEVIRRKKEPARKLRPAAWVVITFHVKPKEDVTVSHKTRRGGIQSSVVNAALSVRVENEAVIPDVVRFLVEGGESILGVNPRGCAWEDLQRKLGDMETLLKNLPPAMRPAFEGLKLEQMFVLCVTAFLLAPMMFRLTPAFALLGIPAACCSRRGYCDVNRHVDLDRHKGQRENKSFPPAPNAGAGSKVSVGSVADQVSLTQEV